MRDLRRTDPKHMVLQNELYNLSKENTSSVMVQSGLQESWLAEALECCGYLRDVQDLLADGQTPYERRYNSPFDGPISLFGAEVIFHPTSSKDKERVPQFGAKALPGMFFGYA